ncbi:ABC-type transport auxiliary lipoprotein family protein [Cupriavidus sp. IDO]|uniref:ABC-type transport auxiliary lipoprotein family protein n=1 Tax=Cupriavidus sp. IDO TaxID=1539142 RepID=UPI0005796E16|nr:ABC-type transport auxiliary lipoprotein family protein [Cupriavidus sp. IDO]KWR88054.1 ABC transporter [Cupriavidus sp. IDO]
MTVAATIGALCILSLSACTLFTPVDIDTKKYALSTIPDDLPIERTHPATLLVLVPETAPAYATSRMAYTTRKYQIAYFSQNEWVETPAQMMLPLIVETLRRTHYFSAVLSPPDFGRQTFMLHTEIIELSQDFMSDPAVLRLTARFDLRQETTNRLIAAKELSVQVRLADRTPYAGVVAANEAAGRLLRELSRFVIENAH